MGTLRCVFLAGLLGLSMTMPLAWAQDQSQDQSQDQGQTTDQPAQPIQAIRSPLASAADNGDATDQNNSEELNPDTRPVSGAQDLSLGTPAGGENYWQPHVTVTSNFDSNPFGGTGGWAAWATILGGVDLHRDSQNTKLMLSYQGGGSISNSYGAGNTDFQALGVSEEILWGKTTIVFVDSLSYLPEAAFGYAGATGTPLSSGGTVGLQNGFYPDQGILTPQTQSIANSSVAQVQIHLTPRTSLTFDGGYNLLHFFGANLLDSGGPNFRVGYNYQLTPQDTLGVSYGYRVFSYSNFNQWIHSNSLQVNYARRITGRLALRVGAGPSFATSEASITGSSSSSGGGTAAGPTSQIFFGASAQLTYQLERTALGLSYSHGISGGSGVLAGSVSNFLTGSVTRNLSPALSAGLNFGYSRNTGLSIATTTPSIQSFNYTYVGPSLNWRWGRSTNLSVGYELQYQYSSAPPCVGAGCGTNCKGIACATSYLQHAVFFTLNWKTQPIPF